MSPLYAHANVENTCLRILREKGYSLKVYEDGDGYLYEAQNGQYDFLAHDPIALLGLIAIYDFKGQPDAAPQPYWWVVKGDNIRNELQDTAIPWYEIDEE
jgi:hypothetical protein